MLGPYIKSRGSRGTAMSANTDLNTVETYGQQGKQFENQFFIYGPKCKKIRIFWDISGALRGCLLIRLGLYLCTCQIRKQSDKKFLSLNPKYEKINFFSYLRALTSNPGERKYQGSKTSSQSRHMYRGKTNNHQFFIYGPQYKFVCIFGYSGGPGWPINNRIGPILLSSYPLTYINLHINMEAISGGDRRDGRGGVMMTKP